MIMATAMVTGTLTMFDFDFMQNAFMAAAIVAVVSGSVGYFLVLRGQTFAGHALSHIGFTGATGAVLIGMSPLWGLVLMTVLGGVGMGLLGRGSFAPVWARACRKVQERPIPCSGGRSPPVRRWRRGW